MKWDITFLADLDTVTISVIGNTFEQINEESVKIDNVLIELPYCKIRKCTPNNGVKPTSQGAEQI